MRQDSNIQKDSRQFPVFQSSTSSDFAPPPPPPPEPVLPKNDLSQQPPPQPPASPNQNTQSQANSKKRVVLKTVLVLILVVFLIIVLGFSIYKFLPSFLGGGGGKEVNLTWWGLWEDETIVSPIIEEWERENPNIKINYVSQSKEDYRDRLRNSLDKGEGPDIMRIHNSWIPMFKSKLSTVPSSVYSQAEFQQIFFPVAVNDLSSESGFLGIPLMYDGLGLFINEEIFSTYARPTPETWDELRDTAVALTIKNENGFITQAGVALGNAKNVDHWQEILALMMLQNGADLNKPVDQRTQGAIDWFVSISRDYKIWDDTLPPSTVYFASGKLAMYFGPSWRAIEIINQNPNLKFRVVPVPQLPKSDPSEKDTTYATYWIESVWNESKNQDEAWKFIKYLSEKETLQKFYQSATQSSAARRFGEPYPRRDMYESLLNDPVLGGIIKLAPDAKSWYLASRTFDGKTGINSRLSGYFEDAINKALSLRLTDKDMQTLSTGVQTVLSDYQLIAPPVIPAN